MNLDLPQPDPKRVRQIDAGSILKELLKSEEVKLEKKSKPIQNSKRFSGSSSSTAASKQQRQKQDELRMAKLLTGTIQKNLAVDKPRDKSEGSDRLSSAECDDIAESILNSFGEAGLNEMLSAGLAPPPAPLKPTKKKAAPTKDKKVTKNPALGKRDRSTEESKSRNVQQKTAPISSIKDEDEEIYEDDSSSNTDYSHLSKTKVAHSSSETKAATPKPPIKATETSKPVQPNEVRFSEPKVYQHPLDFEQVPAQILSAEVLDQTFDRTVKKLQSSPSDFPNLQSLLTQAQHANQLVAANKPAGVQLLEELEKIEQGYSEVDPFGHWNDPLLDDAEEAELLPLNRENSQDSVFGVTTSIVAELTPEEEILYSYPATRQPSKAELYDASGKLIPRKISIPPQIMFSSKVDPDQNVRLQTGVYLGPYIDGAIKKQPISSIHLKMNVFRPVYSTGAVSASKAHGYERAMYGRVYSNYLTGRRLKPTWKHCLPAIREALTLMRVGEQAWFKTDAKELLVLSQKSLNLDWPELCGEKPTLIQNPVQDNSSQILDTISTSTPSCPWVFRVEVGEVWVRKPQLAISQKPCDVESKYMQDLPGVRALIERFEKLRGQAPPDAGDMRRTAFRYLGRMSTWGSEATKQAKPDLLEQILQTRREISWVCAKCDQWTGNYKTAIGQCSYLLSSSPNRHEVARCKAECLEAVGDLTAALGIYQQLADTAAVSRIILALGATAKPPTNN